LLAHGVCGADFAFPEDEDAPAQLAEGGAVGAIAGDVAGALGGPEVSPGGRLDRAVFATVTVPEAAVDEDGGPEFRQDDVGTAGQIFAMQAEAEAHRVQGGADAHFGFCIGGADGGHVAAALLGIVHVGHGEADSSWQIADCG